MGGVWRMTMRDQKQGGSRFRWWIFQYQKERCCPLARHGRNTWRRKHLASGRGKAFVIVHLLGRFDVLGIKHMCSSDLVLRTRREVLMYWLKINSQVLEALAQLVWGAQSEGLRVSLVGMRRRSRGEQWQVMQRRMLWIRNECKLLFCFFFGFWSRAGIYMYVCCYVII